MWTVVIASMLESCAQAIEGLLAQSGPKFMLWLATSVVVGTLAALVEGLKRKGAE